MTETQNFDVFQYALLKNTKNASFLSDFIIILQKLTQQEPQGVIASLNPTVIILLTEIAASTSLEDREHQFLV